MKTTMLLDVYPDKSYYKINDKINICLELECKDDCSMDAEIQVYYLNDCIYTQKDSLSLSKDKQNYKF